MISPNCTWDMDWYQSFSINYMMIREKSVRDSNNVYYIVRIKNNEKIRILQFQGSSLDYTPARC